MFVTKRKFNDQIEYLVNKYRRIEDLHWDLLRKHNRLLNHLGLYESVEPQKIELCKKDVGVLYPPETFGFIY